MGEGSGDASHGPVFVVGAVAYDPRVVTIWEGFKAHFLDRGLPIDYVLFSNYERQVETLLGGGIDVAWNSPLAWVRARRLAEAAESSVSALVMRDTDRDLASIIVVREDAPIREVRDLRGCRVGVGAPDSPQATLLPLSYLRDAGLEDGSLEIVYHDLLGGKHGDHGAAERAEVTAVLDGRVDAACILSGNHILFASEGIVPPGSLRVVAETFRFDHCNFTTGPSTDHDAAARFRDLLLAMSYENPIVKELFDLEGLRAWVPGRTSGYKHLEAAVDESGFYDAWGGITARDYRF